jgi:uncharacterized protein YrzB (UPF0473 family)
MHDRTRIEEDVHKIIFRDETGNEVVFSARSAGTQQIKSMQRCKYIFNKEEEEKERCKYIFNKEEKEKVSFEGRRVALEDSATTPARVRRCYRAVR